MRFNKQGFITLIFMLFPMIIMGQISYSLNDSIKLKELGVCTFGNNIKLNNLNDEFYGPLPDCSNGNYHLYTLEDSLYLLYPNTIDYCGSSSYSCCSSYLIKPNDGYFRFMTFGDEGNVGLFHVDPIEAYNVDMNRLKHKITKIYLNQQK